MTYANFSKKMTLIMNISNYANISNYVNIFLIFNKFQSWNFNYS